MCVCVYVCTLTCMCVCMCVHMCARSCTCVHVCVHGCTYSCVYAYACTSMRDVCTYVQCARDTCMCACVHAYRPSKKLKSWRKSTEMDTPVFVLYSFPLLIAYVKLYILPPTPEYATNFLTLLYEKFEAKNKGVEES